MIDMNTTTIILLELSFTIFLFISIIGILYLKSPIKVSYTNPRSNMNDDGITYDMRIGMINASIFMLTISMMYNIFILIMNKKKMNLSTNVMNTLLYVSLSINMVDIIILSHFMSLYIKLRNMGS